MSGRYTEAVSRQSCPDCMRAGRNSGPLTYYVSDEGPLTFLQVRCTDRRSCGYVETRASATGSDVRKALLQARSRAHVFALVALGEALALGAIATAASALAAMK